MTDLTNFHPYYYNFDYARQFIMPKKKDTSIYEPTNPDYGSMLTSLFKNTASFAVRGPRPEFDYVSYLTHFFLALLFTSHEKNLKRLGIKNSFWRVDPKTKNLEMFIICEKYGEKSLILKTVNFHKSQKRQWSTDSLKSIVSYLNDANEDITKISIESHWYDVTAENIPSDKNIAVPYLFFTLDVDGRIDIDNKVVQDGLKMKRKFRSLFQKVPGETMLEDPVLNNLRSSDENKVKVAYSKLLETLVRVHKQNFYGSLVQDMKSYRSDSQCGFAHGMMLSLQKLLSVKVDIEQTFTLEDPGYRIKITKNMQKSFDELWQEFPLQIDFLPDLENTQGVGVDRSVIYETGPKMGDAEEMPFNTLKEKYIFSYLNFKVSSENYKVSKGLTMAPVESIFIVARREAIITLKDPIVKKLETLRTYLDFEFMYTLQVYKSHYRDAHLNYLSRYIHGYLTSDPVSKEGSAFVIEKVQPNDFESKHMKSFMVNTYDQTIDFIINIYEKHQMSNEEATSIEKLSRSRQYPKSSDRVKQSVIFDFCVSFSPVDRPEYKSLVLTSSKAFMKTAPQENSNQGWIVKQIEPLDLMNEMKIFQGKGTREETPMDRVFLKKVRTIFSNNFHYIDSHSEMKAVLEGMLHDTRTMSNMVYFRKNAHQLAFMDKNKQLCIINFAFGGNGLSAMADVQDFFESDVISGFENVKTFNLAMFKEESRSKASVLPNFVLSVLSRCLKPRLTRSALCSSGEMEELTAVAKNSDIEYRPMKKNYLDTMGKVASGIMYGLMGKDFIADLLRGDYVGMAVNAGLLLSNILTNSLAERMLWKASELTMYQKRILASVLKAGSPFLRRCPSFAFVGFDLYNSIKAYHNNNSDAIINIATDSAYIAIDLAETAIEASEAFGVLEGVSAVTGPIGWTLGAALVLGGEIYRSVRTVQRIDNIIHLTRTEKFTEGVRSFFGMDPEKHVQELMSQKHNLEAIVPLMTTFLRQHEFIKSYIFPLLLDTANINVTRIDLRSNRKIKLTRAVPTLPQQFQYFCMPSLVDEYSTSADTHASYCLNAIGLQTTDKNKLNITYIQIPHGRSEVYGMQQEVNVFDLVSDGQKMIIGGLSDDVFIVRSQNIRGSLFGGAGDNTLDFSPLKDKIDLEIFDYFTLFPGERFFFHHNMTSVVGRSNLTDRIIAWCSLKNIALMGGNNYNQSGHDMIMIQEISCEYNLTIVITGYMTRVINRAFKGHFTYAMSNLMSNFEIYIWHRTIGSHDFTFDYAAYEVSNITIQSIDLMLKMEIIFSGNIIGFMNFPTNCMECRILFKDGNLQQMNSGEFILNITSEASIEDRAELYEKFATNFNISVIIHSLSEKKTASLNRHSFKSQSHGVYSMDVVYSDSHDQVFHSNAHELIYIFRRAKDETISKTLIVNTDIHQKIVIDFRAIALENNHLSFSVITVGDNITLKVTANDVAAQFFNISIVNAMKEKSYKNIFVRGRTTMIFSSDGNSTILLPLPLEFDDKKDLVIISPEDDLEHGTVVKFNRSISEYDCFHMKKRDLIITNTLLIKDENQYFTLIAVDYFRNELIRSLKLKFIDTIIDLKAFDCLADLESMDYFTKHLLYKRYSSDE